MNLKTLSESAVALGKENFRLTTGLNDLTEQFAAMLKYAPDTFGGYALIRAGLMRGPGEGGALDMKTKSLIFILLSIMAGDSADTKVHLVNAVKGGLTMPELAEALTQVLMVGGISTWNQGCAPLLEEAERLIHARDGDM
jgi:alkylhydroperoxidase/carboxymuconolactone decarboxylase family protein YurZ